MTEEQIRDFFRKAFEAIDGAPSRFIFNMDEMGHQDWADRVNQVCVVPLTHKSDHVYLLVSRASKRITLMACIAEDGSAITPQIVIPRKTVDENLFLTGLPPEKVVIRSQPKGYVTTALFDDWFTQVFLPALANRRAAYGYDGLAVLLLGNCSAHHGALFVTLRAEYHIRVVFSPPHSSNQLHPLDLCLFGVTKKLLRWVNNLNAVNVQTKHTAGVICAFPAVAVPLTILRTFEMSGICHVKDGAQLLCTIRPERVKR
jgi:hypothetical protein